MDRIDRDGYTWTKVENSVGHREDITKWKKWDMKRLFGEGAHWGWVRQLLRHKTKMKVEK